MNAIDKVLINTATNSVPVNAVVLKFLIVQELIFTTFDKYNSISLNQQCLLIILTDRAFEYKHSSATHSY